MLLLGRSVSSYLKSITDYRLAYNKSVDIKIVGYSDAGYVDFIQTQKSTIVGTFVYWRGQLFFLQVRNSVL